MNILLFGGSFDPVHNGHLHIVREALKLLPSMDRVYFLPSAQSPGKKAPTAAATERLAYLELALRDTGWAPLSLELERAPPSYTVDSLEALEQPGQRLFWLLGADAYKGLCYWKEPETIRELATLVVVNRQGVAPALPQDPRDILLTIPEIPWSSTSLRQELGRGVLPEGAFPKYLEEQLKNDMLRDKNPYVSL